MDNRRSHPYGSKPCLPHNVPYPPLTPQETPYPCRLCSNIYRQAHVTVAPDSNGGFECRFCIPAGTQGTHGTPAGTFGNPPNAATSAGSIPAESLDVQFARKKDTHKQLQERLTQLLQLQDRFRHELNMLRANEQEHEHELKELHAKKQKALHALKLIKAHQEQTEALQGQAKKEYQKASVAWQESATNLQDLLSRMRVAATAVPPISVQERQPGQQHAQHQQGSASSNSCISGGTPAACELNAQQAQEKARKLQEQADRCQREAEEAELLQQQAEAAAASMPELRAALQFQKQVESYQSVPPLQKTPETPVPEQNATAAASSSAAQASAPEAAAQ